MANPAKLVIGSNAKIGLTKRVGSFNLPRIVTCPGASDACKAVCYAKRGHFGFKVVQTRLQKNLEGSRQDDFVDSMVPQCRRVDIIRLHSSGDFYDPAYVDAWRHIAEFCPDTLFSAYTRSWNAPGFWHALERLEETPNFQLFLSVDGLDVVDHQFRHAFMVKD